jgi:hypothetical protein
MPFQRLEVARPKGLVTDLSPYELPNELWTSVLNADFNKHRSSTALGYATFFTQLPDLTANFAMSWTDFNMPYWLVGTDTAIYRVQSDKQKNISYEGNAYTGGRQWQGSGFNGAAIMNNGFDAPQFYSTISSQMEPLIAWPEFTSCAVIRPYKNYLVALDITKNTGQRYPVMVKWSDPADAGGVPLSWDETSPETQAGESLLPDTSGRAIDGLALNDNFFIYKSDSVWAMSFTGGVFVFNFRRVFADDGIMGRDCVAEIEGKHYVVGTNDIYVHDGTQKSSVVDDVVRDFFFSDLHDEYKHKVKVVYHSPTSELWVYYPSHESVAGEQDKAMVFNTDQGDWTFRDLPDGHQFMTVGYIDHRPSEWWDDSTLTWDEEDELVWGQEELATINTDLVSVTNTFFVKMSFEYSHAGADYLTKFERIGIDMGDDHNVKYVHSITPHMVGNGTVQCYIGGEMAQGEGVYWETAVPFEIGVDKKVDVRHSSRYLAISFQAQATDAQFSLTGYTIEYEPTAGEK